MKIITEIPFKTIHLNNLEKIVLFNRLNNKLNSTENARNIYKLSSNEEIIWQIKSNFDLTGGSFTNIYFNNQNNLEAYRWDGSSYSINLQDGLATPLVFLK